MPLRAVAAAGGSNGAVQSTGTIVPASDVAYSVSAGVLVGAGVLSGKRIQGSAYITRVQEYAAGRIEIDFDTTGAPQDLSWQHDKQCPSQAPGIMFEEDAVGDFDLSVEFKMDNPVSDSFQGFGPAIWMPGSASDDDSNFLGCMFGDATTTTGRFKLYRLVKGVVDAEQLITTYATNLRQFGRLVRAADSIQAWRKTLVGDSWAAVADKDWGVIGQGRLGLAIGTDVTVTGTITIYQIDYAYYPASQMT